jgi:DNA-binding transcriptional ArsR family regulator
MNRMQSYLKFLHLVQVVRETPGFPALDAVEERVLNIFAVAWYEGREITVLEAMKMLPGISESTVFRRIKSLRQKGMVSLNMDEKDRRTRYIRPSELANRYFDILGGCLKKAQQA